MKVDQQEAKQVLRRINELHFTLHPEPLTKEYIKQMEEELEYKLKCLRDANFPAALIHADFIEQCGRYVFLDAITQ